MRRYVLSPSARRDLEGIARYVTDAAGQGIAVQVITRIREKCDLLAETPGEIGRARPELGEGIRSFPVPPHVLFFRYRESEVQIIRILHERQDLERSYSESLK